MVTDETTTTPTRRTGRRRAPRRARDAYMSPNGDFLIAQLLQAAPISGHIFEPCVGDGSLSRPLRACLYVHDVTTSDIAPTSMYEALRRSQAGQHVEIPHYSLDATDPNTYARVAQERGRIDWTVTNPPFSRAAEIIQAALRYSRVAMLLRISFLEPTRQREQFLTECPPSAIRYMPRMSFTSDGKTDSVTVMWAIWDWTRPGAVSVSPRLETWEAVRALQGTRSAR